MTVGITLPVRLSVMALLISACQFYSSVPAAAEPADQPDVAPEIAATRFVSAINEFAGSLGDELLIYASSVFFKDVVSYARAVEIKPAKLRQVYAMKFGWIARKGLRYILHPAAPVPEGLPPVLVLFYVDGVFKIDLDGSYRYQRPPPPDVAPQNIFPSLDDALVGVEGEGSLTAVFHFGRDADIRCALLPDEAPQTVASFVALARGLRAVRIAGAARDGNGEADGEEDGEENGEADGVNVSWVKRPWYDGSHGEPVFGRRAIRLEGAEAPGFFIEDEFVLSRRHDRPALLTTVPRSPDMWGGVLAITTAPIAELDDVGTIFGVCDEAAVEKLARIWSVGKGDPFIPPLFNISIIRE